MKKSPKNFFFFLNYKLKNVKYKNKYFIEINIPNLIGKNSYSLVKFFIRLKTPFYLFFNDFSLFNFFLKNQLNNFLYKTFVFWWIKLNSYNNIINLFQWFFKTKLNNKLLNILFLFLKISKNFQDLKTLLFISKNFIYQKLLSSRYRFKFIKYFSFWIKNLNSNKKKKINFFYWIFFSNFSIFFWKGKKLKLKFFRQKIKIFSNLSSLKLKFFTYFMNSLDFEYLLLSNNNNLIKTNNIIFCLDLLKTSFFSKLIFNKTFLDIETIFLKKKNFLEKNSNMWILLKSSFIKQLSGLTHLNMAKILVVNLTRNGKKLKAWKLFIRFLKIFQRKYNLPGLLFFIHAVLLIEPKIWIKKKKIAGKIYEIPIYISSKWSKSIAVRWLISAAKKWKKSNFADSLAKEVWDASFSRGLANSYKEQIHLTAKKNKAFLWWTS